LLLQTGQLVPVYATAEDVAAAVEAANAKRREVQEVLAKLKLTSITADDLAAGDLRRVGLRTSCVYKYCVQAESS
jgi:hypothetical protein